MIPDSKNQTWRRPRLLWAFLFMSLALSVAAGAWAAEKARRQATEPQDDPAPALIDIKFADKRIPDIHVTGEAASSSEPYGIHFSEAEQRARDQAAAMAPPPDPNLYSLEWESHEALDSQRLSLAGEELMADRGVGEGWGGWQIPSDSQFYYFRPFFWREPAQPTPPDAHATYNITEYNAALGEWRRAQERAARDQAQAGERAAKSSGKRQRAPKTE